MLTTRQSIARPAGPRGWPVALVSILVVTAFAAARALVMGHGHISALVNAGTYYVGPHPHLVRGYGGSIGFDGQFSYRMALDPLALHRDSHGVRLDSALREQRILYPALVWLVSFGGRLALVPWALVGVNIVAYGALASAGTRFALDAGRSRWAGLLVAAPWCLLFSLGRDLNEVVAGALLAWGVWAVRRRRWGEATALLTAGVLTRESLLITVAAVAVVSLNDVRRGLRRFGRSDAAWVVPFLVFALWQVICRVGYGHFPVVDGTHKNFGPPVAGVLGATGYWFGDLGRATDIGLQFLLLLGLTASVLPALRRRSSACTVERVAWVLWLFYVACESKYVWTDAGEFRASSDLQILTAILTLSALARPVRGFSLASGIGLGATAARRVLYI